MGRNLYEITPQGGIKFTSRRMGQVRVANYVYDIWLPILGAKGVAVYSVYCRLEREGVVKAITQADLARACRIGPDTLRGINEQLEECGFVKITKPTAYKRLMHWTTEVEVYDPPTEVPAEIVEKYQHRQGYKALSTWLVAPETVGQQLPSISEETNQSLDEQLPSCPNVVSLGLNTLDVANTTTNVVGQENNNKTHVDVVKSITPTNVEVTPTHVGDKATGRVLGESIQLLEDGIEIEGPFDVEFIEMAEPDHVEDRGAGFLMPDGRYITQDQLTADLAPDGYPRDCEEIFEFATPAPRVQRTKVEREAIIARAMDTYQHKHSLGGESEIAQTWANVPTAQGVILTCFHRLSGMAEPVTKSRRDSATHAAEVLYKEIGSARDVCKRLDAFFAERAKGEKYQFDIVSLHSLVNTLCAMQEQAAGPKIIRVGG